LFFPAPFFPPPPPLHLPQLAQPDIPDATNIAAIAVMNMVCRPLFLFNCPSPGYDQHSALWELESFRGFFTSPVPTHRARAHAADATRLWLLTDGIGRGIRGRDASPRLDDRRTGEGGKIVDSCAAKNGSAHAEETGPI